MNGNAVVFASSVTDANPKTQGVLFNGSAGTIYGNVTLANNFTIPSDQTLTIPSGATLINNGSFTNNGTITVSSGGTLTQNGTVIEKGTVDNSGTINGTNGWALLSDTPPSITTASLPNGTFAAAYSQTLTADGYNITWSIASGELPDGLELTSATGEISGTPTAVGEFIFTVKAADFDTKELSIEITPKPLTDATITLDDTTFAHTGNPIEPSVVSVIVDGITLTSGDYDVSYSNNTAVGAAATVTVTAKADGNFSGSASRTFTISVPASILSAERVIPGGNVGVENFQPLQAVSFTAGPNPVVRQSGEVKFFWQGKRVESGGLTVFDAAGNVVSRVAIKDTKDIKDGNNRRIVGSWDLTDGKGRIVSEGTYLVRGVIVVDGKRERVSVLVGVR